MIFKIILLLAVAAPPFQEPWGKDSGMHAPLPPTAPRDLSLGARLAEAVIDFHQTIISPCDGPRSHFRPSSSQYMKIAVYRYGFIKGFLMGCDRLLRENEEEWIYRYIDTPQGRFKYDPACLDKGSMHPNEIAVY